MASIKQNLGTGKEALFGFQQLKCVGDLDLSKQRVSR